MKKALIVCTFVLASAVAAGMAVGASRQPAEAAHRATPIGAELPVVPAGLFDMAAPQAPYDSTEITPMETVGAPASGG